MQRQLEKDVSKANGHTIMCHPVYNGVLYEIVDNTSQGGGFGVVEPNYPNAQHPSWSTLDRAERYCQLHWEENY